MSSAEQQRRLRATRSGRAGVNGRPPVEPCGTPAAYRRHRDHGEDACAACKAAWAKQQRDYREARK